jgi:hypothetical protein
MCSVQMLLLGLSLILGQFFERSGINWASEAGVALVVGIVLGLIVTLASNVNSSYYDFFKFQVREKDALSQSALRRKRSTNSRQQRMPISVNLKLFSMARPYFSSMHMT